MRLQFRLRTLLIGMVLVSVGMGWFLYGEVFYTRQVIGVTRCKDKMITECGFAFISEHTVLSRVRFHGAVIYADGDDFRLSKDKILAITRIRNDASWSNDDAYISLTFGSTEFRFPIVLDGKVYQVSNGKPERVFATPELKVVYDFDHSRLSAGCSRVTWREFQAFVKVANEFISNAKSPEWSVMPWRSGLRRTRTNPYGHDTTQMQFVQC